MVLEPLSPQEVWDFSSQHGPAGGKETGWESQTNYIVGMDVVLCENCSY